MSEQRFDKGACGTCGGTIEYPGTAQGMTVECPHCHQQTVLQPVERRASSVSKLLIFAVVGVVLAVGVLVLIKGRQAPSKAASAPEVISNAAPANEIVEAPRPKLATDLKVIGEATVEKAKGSRLTYAMGTLANDSDHGRYGVRIEIDLFDKDGNKLAAQANDYVQHLEARKEWKFRALVLDGKAVSAKVASIKEEE